MRPEKNTKLYSFEEEIQIIKKHYKSNKKMCIMFNCCLKIFIFIYRSSDPYYTICFSPPIKGKVAQILYLIVIRSVLRIVGFVHEHIGRFTSSMFYFHFVHSSQFYFHPFCFGVPFVDFVWSSQGISFNYV